MDDQFKTSAASSNQATRCPSCHTTQSVLMVVQFCLLLLLLPPAVLQAAAAAAAPAGDPSADMFTSTSCDTLQAARCRELQ
jgi:hypothetical protein